ncbi:MAG: hypothetical protein IJ599_02870 [Alphaproteobacteria bacterium]|nr:hypothetical protein [Alphaproteobacteria bacterium]
MVSSLCFQDASQKPSRSNVIKFIKSERLLLQNNLPSTTLSLATKQHSVLRLKLVQPPRRIRYSTAKESFLISVSEIKSRKVREVAALLNIQERFFMHMD